MRPAGQDLCSSLAICVVSESEIDAPVGDEAVERVCHLHTEALALVELQPALVFAVHRLVPEEARRRHHGRRHAVADEEDDVLGLARLGEGQDGPVRDRLAAAVVLELELVLARVEAARTPNRHRVSSSACAE